MTNENKNIEIMDMDKMNESNSRGRNRKAEKCITRHSNKRRS